MGIDRRAFLRRTGLLGTAAVSLALYGERMADLLSPIDEYFSACRRGRAGTWTQA